MAITAAELQAVVTLEDKAFQAGMQRIHSEVNQIGATLGKMSASFAQLGLALSAAVTAPIVGVTALGISFNAMRESAQVAFTQLLGSAQKADAFLRELAQFAAQTPFEFPELVQAAQKFVAVGIEAKNVIPIMTALGDAVAAFGGSSDTIQRVTEQIIQMVGKGKVAMEEMRIIGQSIPGSLQAMAQEMGITVDELFKKMEKGSVTAAEGLEAMLVGLTKKFHGNMEKQSQTFSGLMSTLKDSIRFAAGDITESLFNIIKGGLSKLVEYLPKVVVAFQAVPDQIKLMTIAIAGVVAAVGPVLFALGGVVALLGGPLTLAIVGVTGAIIAFTAAVVLNFNRIVSMISASTGSIRINFIEIARFTGAVLDAFQVLARGAIVIFDVIVTGAVAMAQGVKGAFEGLKSAAKAALALATNDVVGFASAMGEMGNTVIDTSAAMRDSMKGLAQRMAGDLKEISGHLSGTFANSFARAAASAGNAVSTTKRSMDEIIASLRDAFNKMGKTTKEGTEKVKTDTAIVNAQMQRFKELLDAINVDRLENGLEELDIAFKRVGHTIQMSGNTLAELPKQLIEKYEKLGFTFKAVLPAISNESKSFVNLLKHHGVEVKAFMESMAKSTEDNAAKMGQAWTDLINSLPAEQLKRKLDSINNQIAASTNVAVAKFTVGLQSTVDGLADMFGEVGKQMGLFGSQLERFVEGELRKAMADIDELSAETVNKLIETWKRASIQLPGVWNDLFRNASSKVKGFAADILNVFDALPGKWGQSLNRALNEIERWISFLDSAIKLIQRMMGDEQTGLGGIISGVVSVFKKTTSQIGTVIKDGFGSDWLKAGIESAKGAGAKIGEGITSGISSFLSGPGGILAALTGAIALSISTFQSPSKYKRFLGSFALGGVVGGLLAVFFGGPSERQKAEEAAAIQQARDAIKLSAESVLQAVQTTIQSSVETFKRTLEFFDKLDEFTNVRKAKFQAFFRNFGRMMDLFFDLAKKWSTESMTKAKAAAEAIAPVVDVISALPNAFEGINSHFGVAQSAIDRFFADFSKVMDAFFERSEVWIDGISKRAMKVANRLLPVVELISNFGTALANMNNVAEPSDSVFDAMGRVLDRIIASMGVLANKFDKALLKSVGNLAEKGRAAIEFAGSIGAVLQAMIAAPTVSEADVDAFLASVALVLDKTVTALGAIVTDGLAKAGAVAEAAGPIVTLLSSIGDAISSAVGAAAQQIPDFSNLKLIIQGSIQAIIDIAQSMSTQGVAAAAIFSQSAGVVMEFLGKVAGALGSLDKMFDVGFNFAFIKNATRELIQMVIDLAQEMGTEGVAAAAKFAASSTALATFMSSVAGAFKAVQDAGAVSVQMVIDLVGGFKLFVERLNIMSRDLGPDAVASAVVLAEQLSTVLASASAMANTLNTIAGVKWPEVSVWDSFVDSISRMVNALSRSLEAILEGKSLAAQMREGAASIADDIAHAASTLAAAASSMTSSALTGGLPQGGTAVGTTSASSLAPLSAASRVSATTSNQTVLNLHVHGSYIHEREAGAFLLRVLEEERRRGVISGSVFTGNPATVR